MDGRLEYMPPLPTAGRGIEVHIRIDPKNASMLPIVIVLRRRGAVVRKCTVEPQSKEMYS